MVRNLLDRFRAAEAVAGQRPLNLESSNIYDYLVDHDFESSSSSSDAESVPRASADTSSHEANGRLSSPSVAAKQAPATRRDLAPPLRRMNRITDMEEFGFSGLGEDSELSGSNYILSRRLSGVAGSVVSRAQEQGHALPPRTAKADTGGANAGGTRPARAHPAVSEHDSPQRADDGADIASVVKRISQDLERSMNPQNAPDSVEKPRRKRAVGRKRALEEDSILSGDDSPPPRRKRAAPAASLKKPLEPAKARKPAANRKRKEKPLATKDVPSQGADAEPNTTRAAEPTALPPDSLYEGVNILTAQASVRGDKVLFVQREVLPLLPQQPSRQDPSFRLSAPHDQLSFTDLDEVPIVPADAGADANANALTSSSPAVHRQNVNRRPSSEPGGLSPGEHESHLLVSESIDVAERFEARDRVITVKRADAVVVRRQRDAVSVAAAGTTPGGFLRKSARGDASSGSSTSNKASNGAAVGTTRPLAAPKQDATTSVVEFSSRGNSRRDELIRTALQSVSLGGGSTLDLDIALREITPQSPSPAAQPQPQPQSDRAVPLRADAIISALVQKQISGVDVLTAASPLAVAGLQASPGASSRLPTAAPDGQKALRFSGSAVKYSYVQDAPAADPLTENSLALSAVPDPPAETPADDWSFDAPSHGSVHDTLEPVSKASVASEGAVRSALHPADSLALSGRGPAVLESAGYAPRPAAGARSGPRPGSGFEAESGASSGSASEDLPIVHSEASLAPLDLSASRVPYEAQPARAAPHLAHTRLISSRLADSYVRRMDDQDAISARLHDFLLQGKPDLADFTARYGRLAAEDNVDRFVLHEVPIDHDLVPRTAGGKLLLPALHKFKGEELRYDSRRVRIVGAVLAFERADARRARHPGRPGQPGRARLPPADFVAAHRERLRADQRRRPDEVNNKPLRVVMKNASGAVVSEDNVRIVHRFDALTWSRLRGGRPAGAGAGAEDTRPAMAGVVQAGDRSVSMLVVATGASVPRAKSAGACFTLASSSAARILIHTDKSTREAYLLRQYESIVLPAQVLYEIQNAGPRECVFLLYAL